MPAVLLRRACVCEDREVLPLGAFQSHSDRFKDVPCTKYMFRVVRAGGGLEGGVFSVLACLGRNADAANATKCIDKRAF